MLQGVWQMESTKEKTKIFEEILFKFVPVSSHLLKAIVQIPGNISQLIHKQTLKIYQKNTQLVGFKKNSTPITYIEKNYNKDIESNIKNFLFKHIILDFLMDKIRTKKITLANYPRLTEIRITQNHDIHFIFNLSVAEKIELKEWKNFAFRAPKRKKYKDLDKQVSLFIKRETTAFKKSLRNLVQENDWVFFEAILVDENNTPVIKNYKSNFWIKVNNKYISKPFQKSLIGKKIENTLITENLPLQNEFSSVNNNHQYKFLITIKKITKGKSLCLESFKTNFKLKSKLEVHKKLIEVFSYRNDISQRKAIIEELFHLLLSKHRFEVPKHFIMRRQEDILHSLKQHPDYQVYKIQTDFNRQIELLAEKQLQEEILIDQISYKENIKIDEKDIHHYLHLFNSNRLKEFVYFKPILERIEDAQQPLQTGILKQSALREKTLNHIIHVLTK
jgi:FKBP-type peptidyl-prolyl cis-trans isomerase (trigger factor)